MLFVVVLDAAVFCVFLPADEPAHAGFQVRMEHPPAGSSYSFVQTMIFVVVAAAAELRLTVAFEAESSSGFLPTYIFSHNSLFVARQNYIGKKTKNEIVVHIQRNVMVKQMQDTSILSLSAFSASNFWISASVGPLLIGLAPLELAHWAWDGSCENTTNMYFMASSFTDFYVTYVLNLKV